MKQSKQQRLVELQALVTGVPKYASTAVLQLDGQGLTASQFVSLCSALVTADNATLTAKAAYQAALAAEQKLFASDFPVVAKARQDLALMFGNSPTVLANLAITPRKKPTPATAEALVARAAKAKATREARGTKGTKQKAAIVGNVSGVTIVPVTLGAVASVAPAPVPTTPAPAVTVAGSTAAVTGGTTSHG